MALTEALRLVIDADTRGAVQGLSAFGSTAEKELKKGTSNLDKFGAGMSRAGVGMVATGALMAGALYNAGTAASDLGETVSQSSQIFGDAQGKIQSFAEGAAGSLGQSERAAREAANTFGLFFTNAGKSSDEAADMSIELTKLASDMASFKNTSPEQAVEALGAALRGESEPIRAYGVMLDDATLKQRAMDMGLVKTTSETLPPAVKMQAAYAEILAQTGTIQGDFERTSGGLANQQRILAAEFENAKAAIGAGALPIMTKLTGVAADATTKFVSLDKATGGAVGRLATWATGALLVGGAASMVIGKTIQMRDNFNSVGISLRNSQGGLTRWGKAAGALGIAGVVYGLVEMGRAMDGLQIDADGLSDAFTNLNGTADEELRLWVQVAAAFGGLGDAVSNVADVSVPAAERMIEFAEANGVAADEIEELRGIVEEKRATDVQGAVDQENYASEVDEAAAATGDLTTALEAEETALQGVLDATLAQFDANLGYRQSVDSVEESISTLRETQRDHGLESEEYRDALLDAEGAILDQAAAAVRLYEDTVKASGGTLNAQQKTAVYKEELKRLAAQLAPGSALRKQIEAYINQLDRIPSTINTKINASVDITGGGYVGANAGRGYLAQGGPVYAAAGMPIFRPRGTDTVPAMLTPGEFVMRKSAVDRIGMPTLAAMNRGAVPGGGGDTIIVQVGDREVARLYADGKVRAERRGISA